MKIAIVCASGIGDLLILHSLANLLTQKGWEVTTHTNHRFDGWLPGFRFASEEDFSGYDAIFLQHDNSARAIQIRALPIPVYTFYGAHSPAKHGPLRSEWDYVCDRSQTMVENVARAGERFFGERCIDNGLRPLEELIHRRYPKRIAIHPTGSSPDKIWPRDKFRAVAAALAKLGYDPVFTVSPSECSEWGASPLKTLSDLSSFIYESGAFLGNDSGPGHLASSLHIPHLIIGGNGLQMPLWRTGWLPGELVTPQPWLMQFKALRPHWKKLVKTNFVINKFIYSTLRN